MQNASNMVALPECYKYLNTWKNISSRIQIKSNDENIQILNMRAHVLPSWFVSFSVFWAKLCVLNRIKLCFLLGATQLTNCDICRHNQIIVIYMKIIFQFEIRV